MDDIKDDGNTVRTHELGRFIVEAEVELPADLPKTEAIEDLANECEVPSLLAYIAYLLEELPYKIAAAAQEVALEQQRRQAVEEARKRRQDRIIAAMAKGQTLIWDAPGFKDLSWRARRVLRLNFITPEEVSGKPLSRIDGCGPKTRQEVLDWLEFLTTNGHAE